MDKWFIKRGDHVIGPGSLEQLQKAAKKGGITADTLVANNPNGPWIPASQSGILPGMQQNPFLQGTVRMDKRGPGSLAFKLDSKFKERPVYGKSDGYASFLERAIAIIIDSVVLWIGSSLLSLLLTPLFFIASSFATGWFTVITMTLVGTFLPAIVYFIVIQEKWGWTVGRKVMGIHVEMENGSAPDMRVFTIRYVGAMISSVFLLIGYIIALADPKTRTWHDKIAGTVVVKE
jgi:uncharacterized RDD family membrane protein YckC